MYIRVHKTPKNFMNYIRFSLEDIANRAKE